MIVYGSLRAFYGLFEFYTSLHAVSKTVCFGKHKQGDTDTQGVFHGNTMSSGQMEPSNMINSYLLGLKGR